MSISCQFDMPDYSTTQGGHMVLLSHSVGDELPPCPVCGNNETVTWNYFNDDNGDFYHECHECDNLFRTNGRVETH